MLKKVIVALVVLVLLLVGASMYEFYSYQNKVKKAKAGDVDAMVEVAISELRESPAIEASTRRLGADGYDGDASLNEKDRAHRKWIAALLFMAGKRLVLEGDSRFHTRESGFKYLDWAGSLGYAPAWTALGCLLREGKNIGRDDALAVRYTQAAAEMGDPWAVGHMAENYWFGIGVERNPYKTVQYAKKAIGMRKEADTLDNYYLGLAYLHGVGGVPADYREAFVLFRKAAMSKDFTKNGKYPDKRVLAYYQLGRMYMEGIGVTVNRQEARRWFEKCLESKEDEFQPGWKEAYEGAVDALRAL